MKIRNLYFRTPSLGQDRIYGKDMDEYSRPMKHWAEDERPREKLLRNGASSLSLNELFAILLRSGVGGETALALARRMLAAYRDDLGELAACSVQELVRRFKGVGLAKAASVVAAMEIGRRRQALAVRPGVSIRFSADAYRYLLPFMQDLDHEEFWVLYLLSSNRVKGCACLSSGGMDATVIDVRLLFRSAIEEKASHIIVAHNHPGGMLVPSRADESITARIAEGGKLLDIRLLDHLIIGHGGYYSFADEGRLPAVGR